MTNHDESGGRGSLTLRRIDRQMTGFHPRYAWPNFGVRSAGATHTVTPHLNGIETPPSLAGFVLLHSAFALMTNHDGNRGHSPVGRVQPARLHIA